MPEEREYEHPSTIQCTLVDGDIPAAIARDAEVTAAVAAHAALPTVHQDAPALIAAHTGIPAAHHPPYTHPAGIQCTLVEGDIPAGIARDAEVTLAIAAHALVAAAHHTKTTDASELVAGNLPAARLNGILTEQGDVMIRGAVAAQALPHGADGQFLKTQGHGANPIWADPTGAWVLPITVCDEHKWRSVGNATWVKRAEIKLKVAGTIKTLFNLKHSHGAPKIAYGRIYKNGVAVGILRSTSSLTYVFFQEDIAGWAIDDLLQLYLSDNGYGQLGHSNIFQGGQGATGEARLC